MTRLIAIASTLSITGFLLIHFLNDPKILSHLLLGMAAGSITLLLVRVFTIVSRFEGAAHQYTMRSHILLHLVPSSYLILQFFTKPSLIVNLLYFVPIMLFFLTGRLTWRTLYKHFGSKVYLFFYKGNTGMLVGLTVLLSLGVLYDEVFSEFFRRAIVVYFGIHLFLIGFAVIKIEHDLSDSENKAFQNKSWNTHT